MTTTDRFLELSTTYSMYLIYGTALSVSGIDLPLLGDVERWETRSQYIFCNNPPKQVFEYGS